MLKLNRLKNMCGIISYCGKSQARSILVDGLKRLEYRGYDSAGITVWDDRQFQTVRRTGKVEELVTALRPTRITGTTGIAHTRWATHGEISENNAHPHLSNDGKFSLVHNGVIENYSKIKSFLEDHGFHFNSETDTEVLVNLIAYHYAQLSPGQENEAFAASVRTSLQHIEGTYGIAVLCRDFPNEIIGARKGSPLILGIGNGEHLLASDVGALVRHTDNVVYLNDNELVQFTDTHFTLSTNDAQDVKAFIQVIDWTVEEAELGHYSHYMQKEIFEQPAALENAMRGRFSDDASTAKFGGLNLTAQELRRISRILFCGCGTAWHACLVAEHLIERFARIPVEVEYASEFRYRNAPLDIDTLICALSQSGETIDTLAALLEAKRKGFRTMAISNVVGSTIARAADGGIYQHAGPEIGVASTKAFTSQLLLAAMFALYLGRLRDMSYRDGLEFTRALKKVPEQVQSILHQADKVEAIANKYLDAKDFLFLGRQITFPIALEGALKLKEISYIHAEGYPAAEMKHGPIALINEECPSVFIATQKEIFDKTIANIQEVKARKGPIIAIANENSQFPIDQVSDCIFVPDAHEAVQPILAAIPMQLLSYYIAQKRGCDVDKPRNLAKAVTVE